MGQKQTKTYKYQPTTNQQCGQICSVFGVVLAAIAVFIDSLTGLYSDDKDDDGIGRCGWNAIIYGGVDVDDSDSSSGYVGTYYEYYCSGDGKDAVDSFSYFTDTSSKDWCNTQTEGVLWLVFSILAMLLALSAIGAVHVNRDKAGKCSDICATLCAIIAVVCWVVNNPICYDDDDLDDETSRLGWSIYLMIVAAVCWLVGGLIA